MGAFQSMQSSQYEEAKKDKGTNNKGTNKGTNNKGTPHPGPGYSYSVSYAPTGSATCRGCNKKIGKGQLRIGQAAPNPFDPEGGASSKYTKYYHAHHAFDTFLKRSRCTSRVPLAMRDLQGAPALKPADKQLIQSKLAAFSQSWKIKCKA